MGQAVMREPVLGSWWGRIAAVCRYELTRSMTWQRLALALVLCLFPPVMLALVTYYANVVEGEPVATFLEFVLIFLVGIVCLLSLLLWASTNVYSELEEKTWIFIATRPKGRMSMIVGKYLAAVISAYAVSSVAITLCVAIGAQYGAFDDTMRSWLGIMGTFAVATFTYGAVFTVIGALFYRRAMVLSAGYVVLFELVLANVPALIGKFTVRYHLQEIGFLWIGWFVPPPQDEFRMLFPAQMPWVHFAAVGIIIAVCMSLACWAVVHRQFITADET